MDCSHYYSHLLFKTNLKEIGMCWEEAQKCWAKRENWCRCVVQCVFDVEWTKDQERISIVIINKIVF